MSVRRRTWQGTGNINMLEWSSRHDERRQRKRSNRQTKKFCGWNVICWRPFFHLRIQGWSRGRKRKATMSALCRFIESFPQICGTDNFRAAEETDRMSTFNPTITLKFSKFWVFHGLNFRVTFERRLPILIPTERLKHCQTKVDELWQRPYGPLPNTSQRRLRHECRNFSNRH